MTGDRVGLITSLTPIILALMAGVGWLIRHHITTSRKAPEGVEVTQGKTVPILSEYLDDELGECRARARVYRDALIRADVDPDEVLRKAGLLKPPTPAPEHDDEG